MTGEAPPTVKPGYCSDHTNQRLVSHHAVGLQRYGPDVETVCPNRDHDDNDRERCRYCGERLIAEGTPAWKVSDRREFCKPNHRLRAFRERTKR